MPLGTLLLSLALLVIVAVIIALPLLDRKTPAIQAPNRREALEQERRDVVRAIRELDFDFRTGKINENDYKRLREAQVQRGADILRALDALSERDVESDMEVHIAALRTNAQTSHDGVQSASDGVAERLKCPQCGHAVAAANRFCPRCGHRLATPAKQESPSTSEVAPLAD